VIQTQKSRCPFGTAAFSSNWWRIREGNPPRAIRQRNQSLGVDKPEFGMKENGSLIVSRKLGQSTGGEMRIDWENFFIYILAFAAAFFVFVGIWKASTPTTRNWARVATIAFVFSLALEVWLITAHVSAQ
jgi:hypothetical protein